jgi:predicted dehydrogenase
MVREKAESAAERFACHAYMSVSELLANEELDAVSVCTSGLGLGSHHFVPVMECLEANIAVLCETPLSADLREAREMVARAQELEVCLGAGLHLRFSPLARQARSWMEEGVLGDTLLMNANSWLDAPTDRAPWTHFRTLHPLSLDVLRYFCGRVVRVNAFCNRAPKPQGTGKRMCWSNILVNLLFENGVVGHLTTSCDAGDGVQFARWEILGTEGRLLVDNAFEEMTLFPRNSLEATLLPNVTGIVGLEGLIAERIRHWVEQLREQTPHNAMEGSGADALAMQEVVEAAIVSWEEECVVEIENG